MQKDWFRNETWDEGVESNFQQRLRRARDKSQYLRIQASYLAESYPAVTLRLLEQYFALGEHFDMAQAYLDKARAMATLGDLTGAVASYEAALSRESVFPQLKTHAYLELACLIVELDIASLYSRGLEVLDSHRDRLMFPIDRYRANGARALLLHRLGFEGEAQAAARLALAAANETQSGFRYHHNLGLVSGQEIAFDRQVADLASKLLDQL